jgi:hypothetical protein
MPQRDHQPASNIVAAMFINQSKRQDLDQKRCWRRGCHRLASEIDLARCEDLKFERLKVPHVAPSISDLLAGPARFAHLSAMKYRNSRMEMIAWLRICATTCNRPPNRGVLLVCILSESGDQLRVACNDSEVILLTRSTGCSHSVHLKGSFKWAPRPVAVISPIPISILNTRPTTISTSVMKSKSDHKWSPFTVHFRFRSTFVCGFRYD